MELVDRLIIMSVLAVTVPEVRGTIFPYWPYNPHLQHYISTQLDFHHPRNLYELRTLYQDDTTRCTLRLWRISKHGDLKCEEDDDCHYGTVCRLIKVCKLTEGRLCWAKEDVHGPCTEDKDCESNNCHEQEKACGYPLLYDPDNNDDDKDDQDQNGQNQSSTDSNNGDQSSDTSEDSNTSNGDGESSYTSLESDPNARIGREYYSAGGDPRYRDPRYRNNAFYVYRY